MADGNTVYFSKDGVLFDKKRSILHSYPGGKSGEYQIPEGVTGIGDGAFSGCGLKSVTISESVKSIGDYAFGDCDSLTSVTIPGSVTSIGARVFFGCGSLADVTISEGVTSIGDFAFSDCYSLTSVTIPGSVTSIGDEIVRNCSNSTIYCIENSYAHRYAVDNEIPYEFILTAGWEPQERAAMPQATVASGTKVEKGTKVNLTCATVGADIYYTTDGTEPTASSAKYAGSLTINEDMTVKAIAVLEGYLTSETAVFTWTVETQKAGESTGEAEKTPDTEQPGEEEKSPTPEKTGEAAKTPSAGTTSEAAKKPATGTTGETEKKPAAKKAVKVKKISVTAPTQQAAAGEKVRLTAQISPKTATNQKVTWSSSNKKYAVVNASGVVTTKRAGAGKTVTITAKAKDGSGVKASIKLKIMKHAVTRVQITGAKKTLKAGKSMTLKAAVKTNGKNANKKLKWTSSNTKYAAVNAKGKVTAKKAGIGKTVTITAEATDGTGKKASVKIKVK